MDCSYDSCMDLFAKGQAERIDAARAFRHRGGKTTRGRTPTATDGCGCRYVNDRCS